MSNLSDVALPEEINTELKEITSSPPAKLFSRVWKQWELSRDFPKSFSEQFQDTSLASAGPADLGDRIKKHSQLQGCSVVAQALLRKEEKGKSRQLYLEVARKALLVIKCEVPSAVTMLLAKNQTTLQAVQTPTKVKQEATSTLKGEAKAESRES